MDQQTFLQKYIPSFAESISSDQLACETETQHTHSTAGSEGGGIGVEAALKKLRSKAQKGSKELPGKKAAKPLVSLEATLRSLLLREIIREGSLEEALEQHEKLMLAFERAGKGRKKSGSASQGGVGLGGGRDGKGGAGAK
jgi:hypothetical protein